MRSINITDIQYILFNDNINANNIDNIEYKYILILIFEYYFIKRNNQIEIIKTILNEVDIPEGEWVDGCPTEELMYFYLFNKIKNDLNTNNQISKNTTQEILIVIDKLIDTKNLFTLESLEND